MYVLWAVIAVGVRYGVTHRVEARHIILLSFNVTPELFRLRLPLFPRRYSCATCCRRDCHCAAVPPPQQPSFFPRTLSRIAASAFSTRALGVLADSRDVADAAACSALMVSSGEWVLLLACDLNAVYWFALQKKR
jgi:hypothetical protein